MTVIRIPQLECDAGQLPSCQHTFSHPAASTAKDLRRIAEREGWLYIGRTRHDICPVCAELYREK